MNKAAKKNWEKEVSRIACHNIARGVLALDVSDVETSDELQARVEALFAQEKVRVTSRRRNIRRRVVAILIAAVLVALTACMSIPSVREKLYRIVITYYDQFFSYKSESVDTEEVTVSEFPDIAPLSDLAGVTFADDGFLKMVPSYIPEGYELCLDSSTRKTTRFYYRNVNDGSIICYEQSLVGTKNYKVNYKNVEVREILINDKQGIVAMYTVGDRVEIALRWNDGIYDYAIDTTITLEEAIKIAESIH